MKLNDREEPFTPICTTENVPLFVMYVKEELPEKHKSKLEAHLSHCADCKMNLAYIKEILQFKHSLSIEEKTLLLKYLSDPLFYYFANNIRKKVLEDVKEIVKEAKVQVNEINEVNNTVGTRVQDRSKTIFLEAASFIKLGAVLIIDDTETFVLSFDDNATRFTTAKTKGSASNQTIDMFLKRMFLFV